MFFAQSLNIEDLVGWFRNDHPGEEKPSFLCFIVAGGLNFDSFFKKFIQQIEAFDLVTGKSIGVFLYSNKLKIDMKLDGGEWRHHKRYHELGFAMRNSRYWHYSEVDYPDIKGGLKSAAYEFSKRVIDYFRLAPEDYPCFLLLGKNDPSPLVLKMKDVVSEKMIYDFFHDLSKLIHESAGIFSWLENYYHLPEKIENSRKSLQTLEQMLISINGEVEKFKNVREEHIENYLNALITLEIPEKLLRDTLEGNQYRNIINCL